MAKKGSSKFKYLLLSLPFLGLSLVLGGVKFGILTIEQPRKYQYTLTTHWYKLPVVGQYFPVEEDELAQMEADPSLAIKAIRAQREELLSKTELSKEEASKLLFESRRLEKELRRIRTTRDDLEALLMQKEDIEEQNLVQLAASYSRMAPTNAARALSEMDDSDLITILARMKEKNVSRIMAEMDPKRAAVITEKMMHVKRR